MNRCFEYYKNRHLQLIDNHDECLITGAVELINNFVQKELMASLNYKRILASIVNSVDLNSNKRTLMDIFDEQAFSDILELEMLKPSGTNTNNLDLIIEYRKYILGFSRQELTKFDDIYSLAKEIQLSSI